MSEFYWLARAEGLDQYLDLADEYVSEDIAERTERRFRFEKVGNNDE